MFLEANELSSNILKLMSEENIYVCRIKNFFDDKKCALYANRIISSTEKEVYEVNKTVGKIGSAIFDYAFNDKIDEYFSLVEKNNKIIDDIFGSVAPSKLVFNELNNAWAHGCKVEHYYGKTAYYGIIRIFDQGGTAPPHQDMTAWDIKNCIEAQSIKKQFSINVYLQVSDDGGDLLVYDKHIDNEQEYQKTFLRYLDIGYAAAHEELVASNTKFVSLKPSTGDLVIFNSQRMHAVSNNLSSTPRISSSFFVNYRSKHEPLCVFS